jgi:hypothetical protein
MWVTTPEKDCTCTIYMEEEEENNERVSFRAQADAFASLLYTHPAGNLFHRIKTGSIFWAHLSAFTFFRSPYLVFRVFRI